MLNLLDDNPIYPQGPPYKLSPLTSIKLLFGSLHFQFGFQIFLFGMVFLWLMDIKNSELVYFFSIDGQWVETDARVINIVSTGSRYYRYVVMYRVNGKSFENNSYGALDTSIKEGQIVRVEYGSLNPYRVRIIGMSSSLRPIWTALIILAIPLFGFRTLSKCLLVGIKTRKLL